MAKKDNIEVAITQSNSPTLQLGSEEIELLKNTLAGENVSLTDTELKLYLYQAKRTGLDPLARQIYVLKGAGKLSIVTSIDGFRLTAERSGKYNGQTKVELELDPEAKTNLNPLGLVSATVGVYRKGSDHPVYATAYWDEYARTTGYDSAKKLMYTWQKMPRLMLAKCAEALALRKAFPQELSGLYSDDEMGHAEETPADAGVAKATRDQFAKMFAVLKAKGVPNAEVAKWILYNLTGVKSLTELTRVQASEVIEDLDTKNKADLELLAYDPDPAEKADEPEKPNEPVEGEVVADSGDVVPTELGDVNLDNIPFD